MDAALGSLNAPHWWQWSTILSLDARPMLGHVANVVDPHYTVVAKFPKALLRR